MSGADLSGRRAVLGVDISGVVIDNAKGEGSALFKGPNYLQALPTFGVFGVLGHLNSGPFAGRVHLISRERDGDIRTKTHHWLDYHQLYAKTGIPNSSARVHYCRERAEKAALCRDLELTHYIDDHLEALGSLIGMGMRLFLFNPKIHEVAEFEHFFGKTEQIYGWSQAIGLLTHIN